MPCSPAPKPTLLQDCLCSNYWQNFSNFRVLKGQYSLALDYDFQPNAVLDGCFSLVICRSNNSLKLRRHGAGVSNKRTDSTVCVWRRLTGMHSSTYKYADPLQIGSCVSKRLWQTELRWRCALKEKKASTYIHRWAWEQCKLTIQVWEEENWLVKNDAVFFSSIHFLPLSA